MFGWSRDYYILVERAEKIQSHISIRSGCGVDLVPRVGSKVVQGLFQRLGSQGIACSNWGTTGSCIIMFMTSCSTRDE